MAVGSRAVGATMGVLSGSRMGQTLCCISPVDEDIVGTNALSFARSYTTVPDMQSAITKCYVDGLGINATTLNGMGNHQRTVIGIQSLASGVDQSGNSFPVNNIAVGSVYVVNIRWVEASFHWL